MDKVNVFYEATPNPQSMKFVVDRIVADRTAQFDKIEDTLSSPLARKIFGFPWSKAVYIGPNFVTVTKQDWVDWTVLADPLSDLLAEHFQSGEPTILSADAGNAAESSQAAGHPSNAYSADPNDEPVVQNIKRIIELEIRPAVAMDGGDVQFVRFDSGVVYLSMLGSCSGCPSSMMTLKDGIESRLRSEFSEITEVVSV